VSDHSIEETEVKYTVRDWNMLQRLAGAQEETNRLLRDNTEATMKRIDALEASMRGLHGDAVQQINVERQRIDGLDRAMFRYVSMGAGMVLAFSVVWGIVKVAAPLIPLLKR